MNNLDLQKVISNTCNKIAPAWPLKNIVAVNPYLGLTDMPFDEAAKILSKRSSISMCMKLSFYLDQLEKGQLTDLDIKAALDKNTSEYSTPEKFINEARFVSITASPNDAFKMQTVLDIVQNQTNKQWNDFMIDRISSWASTYFDEYQALWNTTEPQQDLFQAWRKDAQVDLSPSLMGAKKFRATVKQLPYNSFEATAIVLQRLNLPEDILETYLHSLLLKVIGWSSFVGGKDYNNALYGGNAKHLESFLSILLCWEYCLFESYKDDKILSVWESHKEEAQLQDSIGHTNKYLEAQLIFQDAYDLACQRQFKEKFDNHQLSLQEEQSPKAQAVFCIDVRSEVYRRCLETVDSEVETLGFAGFFGFPVNYVPLAHNHGKNQCPVLIPSGPVVKETISNKEKIEGAKKTRIIKHQVEKTWKQFKSGAISSFGFVSPLGLSYLPKLLSDSFGWTRPTEDPNKDGLGKWLKKGRDLDLSEIPLESKITMAASALTAMGLNKKMAKLVLIAGHGSTSVNNPHATGLDCGACGGHSGEINAMTAERILNNQEVRKGLLEKGIEIPSDTHFIACLHDTTTDELHLIGASNVPTGHLTAMNELKESLTRASRMAREERALRFNINKKDVNASMVKRSKDWSQVRPEWGLAGCNSFIIAPRKRTVGMNLGGKSFLHSYDWSTDEGFNILESIMTAPMVVTSWINLQYYASTTDNKNLGAGNKTLHNVTGGVGVLEGSGGDLRIGLPLQSLHDGKNYQHLPQRLNVIIEAPIEAINTILRKNKSVRDLCDNSWITLLSLDDNGKIEHRYTKDLNWEMFNPKAYATKEKELVTV